MSIAIDGWLSTSAPTCQILPPDKGEADPVVALDQLFRRYLDQLIFDCRAAPRRARRFEDTAYVAARSPVVFWGWRATKWTSGEGDQRVGPASAPFRSVMADSNSLAEVAIVNLCSSRKEEKMPTTAGMPLMSTRIGEPE